MDIFLSQVGYPHFELVIYTVENAMSMFNVCDGLDPQQQHINYRLFRDATQFVNNHPTKVVNELNRDPKKVKYFNFSWILIELGTLENVHKEVKEIQQKILI